MKVINPVHWGMTGMYSKLNGDKDSPVPGIPYSDSEYITDEQINAALADNDHGVAKLTALLRGKEWDDWKERYLPRLMDYSEKMVSNETIEDAENQARESTELGFKHAKDSLALNNERLGMNLSSNQRAHQNKSMGMSETLSKVGAVNDARVGAHDRQNALISGGMAMSINTSPEGES